MPDRLPRKEGQAAAVSGPYNTEFLMQRWEKFMVGFHQIESLSSINLLTDFRIGEITPSTRKI
jgi:hypothetical protein